MEAKLYPVKTGTLFAILILMLSLAPFGKSWGQSLLVDDFTGLTVGNLAGQSGWTKGGSGPDATIANTTPLTYPNYNGGGAEYVVMPTASGTTSRVYKGFTSTTAVGNTFYVSFLLRIASATATGDYFITLGDPSTGTTYAPRLFAKTSGSGFVIGASKTSNVASATFGSTIFTFNTTYLVVLRYSGVTGSTNDLTYVWVNPNLSSEPTTGTAQVTVPASDADPGFASGYIGNFHWHNRSANNPTGAFDGVRVAYGATSALAWTNLNAYLASSNDQTSKVVAPTTQTSAGDITSTSTSSGSAVDVFKFKISDLGTADGLSTKVTQVKIKKSSGSADWTDHIAGATLWDGASQITTGTVTITDADITFPITSGNLDISDGSNRELTLKIWLNSTNIVDNSTMAFSVSQTIHGFTADATGSGFATDFGAGVTGNTMTVRVASTKLLFTTAPSVTACPNTNLTTPPVVKATDANGMTDIDFIGQITLANSGGIGMTNYQLNASSGVATFTNLQFTATGSVTLSATAAGLTDAGPTASISISVGNATSPAATNGNASSVITWTNPSSCIDEIMIVGKAGSAVTLAPTGDGSSYTANLAFGSGTGFDGGFVLYKGSTSSQTVTSLTNGTTYHFTIFTRNGTSWSSGVTTSATPVLSSSATDHFRSKVGDFWENTTTWESSVDGNTWIDATLTPTSSASSITIQSTGIVHLNSSLTVNRLIINSGGKLIIYNTRTLTIGNGSSVYDMDVMGTVECAGNIVVSNDGAAVKFESGSYYKHTGNGGTMVRATWDPNTTCEITGITNATVLTNIGNQNSAYGNLIWNCPGQTNWLYGTLSFDVAGDFIINSTGGANKGIDLVTATANRTFNIYGDLIINNGKLALTITEAIATLNISGNLTIAANSLNVLDMGWDNYSPNGGGNYRSIINLEGNLSVGSGATITTLGDGYGKIVFKKAGEQTYTNSGTITWVDYVINSGSTLKLASNLSLNSSASNAYTEVTVNGTINCGTYAVNESSGYYSLFTLNSNATLITANTGGVNGSLPVSYVDLYPDANYIFNGTANQVAGTLLTEAKNIDLSNTAGKVALSGNVAVSGTLTVPTGNTFDAGSYVISGVGDIDLQSGGTFMSSHPSGLNGNNTTSGGLTDFNTGANYTFYGTSAQVTGTQFPASVNNLTIDNSGGVSLSNPAVTVTNNLTINSGKLFNIDYNKQVNVNGSLINNGDETSLIIKSAAGGTGSLIHNTDNVKATIQRYITGNTNTGIYCYHFVSVPLVPSNNSLSGLFYDSYLWDFYEAENRWRAWGTPTTNILDETRGYIIYYRFAEFTYEFPGPINNGDFSANVTFTEQGASNNEGWNLVPNPYPSGLDWKTVSMSDRPNVEGGIYVWPADNDHSGETSSYYCFVGGISTPAGALDGTIPVGQSVIVHANGSGTPAITFKNSHRVHASQSFLKSTKNTVPDLLYLIASDSTKSDQAAIRFLDEATENFDGEWDAYKLLGGQHTLNICSVSADGFKLAINSLPAENKDIIIPIYFYYTDSAKITIKASNLQSFDTVFPIYFEDKLLDKRVNLWDEDYTFEHHGDTVIDRFQIRFNITYGIDEKNLVDGRAFMLNGKLNIDIPEFENKKVSLQVLDLTGKTVLSGSMKLNGNTQTDLRAATGYYIVRLTDGRRQFVSKLLVH